jgi:hypothetical protein
VETRSPNGEMLAGTSTVAYFECARIDALTWYYSDMRDRVVQERRNQMAAWSKCSTILGRKSIYHPVGQFSGDRYYE